jgi:hypothetical protein
VQLVFYLHWVKGLSDKRLWVMKKKVWEALVYRLG